MAATSYSSYVAEPYAGAELDRSRSLPIPGSAEHISDAFDSAKELFLSTVRAGKARATRVAKEKASVGTALALPPSDLDSMRLGTT